MKKLLIISTVSLTLKSFLLSHAAYFRSLGWQVDGVANGISKDPECLSSFDQCIDINWSRNPLSLKNFISAPQELRKLVRTEKYHIIHVHTPVASFVTRFALRNLRKTLSCKAIYTAHGFHFHKEGTWFNNLLYYSLEKKASQWTDHLIVINEDDYQEAISFNTLPESKISLLPGIGIDFEYYNPQKVPLEKIEEARKKMQLKDDDILFLMIAAFDPGKRHIDAIKALSLIKDKKVHLAFAGTGPTMEVTRELVKELNLAERVHFLGYIGDIRPFILAAKATILPSKREGLPRSIMESLCLGVPCIGSDVRGIRDLLLQFPENLFPLGDINSLADKMIYLQMSKKPFLNPKFSLDNILEKTHELYDILVSDKFNRLV